MAGATPGNICGNFPFLLSDNAPVIAYIYEGGHPLPRDAADVIVKFFKASTTATTRPSATE